MSIIKFDQVRQFEYWYCVCTIHNYFFDKRNNFTKNNTIKLSFLIRKMSIKLQAGCSFVQLVITTSSAIIQYQRKIKLLN